MGGTGKQGTPGEMGMKGTRGLPGPSGTRGRMGPAVSTTYAILTSITENTDLILNKMFSEPRRRSGIALPKQYNT